MTPSHQPQPPVYYYPMLIVMFTRFEHTVLFPCLDNLLVSLNLGLNFSKGVLYFLLLWIGTVAYKDTGQYSLAPSPKSWGTPLSIRTVEPDDYLHNPDPHRDRDIDRGGHICTARGLANLGCLFLLGGGIMMLLYEYFPFVLVMWSMTTQVLLFRVMQCWYVGRLSFSFKLYNDNYPVL